MYTRDVWQATTLITAPAAEPHTLAQIRTHLRVDADLADDNEDITGKYAAAREAVEEWLSQALYKQRHRLMLGRPGRSDSACAQTLFPGYIALPVRPVLQVISVKYIDIAGVLQTLDPALYRANLGDGTIEPAINTEWPDTAMLRGVIAVEWWAGYTDGNSDPLDLGALPAVVGDPLGLIPTKYKQAILLWTGHFYENREAVADGKAVAPMVVPLGVESLLGPKVSV